MSELLTPTYTPTQTQTGDDDKPHHVGNILVLGSADVGKTSIIRRIIGLDFKECYTPTVYDLYEKVLDDIKGRFVFKITDFAGEYSFPPMLRLSISRNDIFLLVYKLADKRSLEYVKNIHDEILGIKSLSTIAFVVVGNKIDDLTCSEEMIKEVENEVDLWCHSHMVMSAKNSCNLDLLLKKLIEETQTLTTRPKLKKKFSLFPMTK